MHGNRPTDRILNLERRMLRALCVREMTPGAWDELVGSLSAYHWGEPDHRVVYDALRGIRSRDSNTRRDQLPAQATRMGFPDLDWSLYLEPEEMTESEIEELIRQMKSGAF